MKELILSANPKIGSKEEIDSSYVSDFASKLQFTSARIEQLNQFRIKRALSANNDAFMHVFSQLPLLIHFNDPQLPVYVEKAPHGIWRFQFTDYQKQLVKANHLDYLFNTQTPFDFDALYSMGSTGSITQTSESDLDLWLCYSDRLSIEQYKSMEIKITKLQEWAKSFGVEINIYLMNPKRFKAKHYNSFVTSEHSGSAQHFFLLDEFYRSAIRLAGKPLLWLHLPSAQYRTANFNPEINLDEWIDFGDFSRLSTSEFFGASLWQLYKGIDNPYKSVLKILLLESYAHTYPETQLISKDFKYKLLSDEEIKYHFDPYLAMLELVTDYLVERNALGKLERLRVCFYIKAMEGETYPGWRQNELQDLLIQWQWDVSKIEELNARKNWGIKLASRHHQMLVEYLLQSYNNLIQFARKYHIDPSIMTNDVDILMRKLYSVFETIPGKVTLINPCIADNLSEDYVTFIEAKEGTTMQQGWYFVNQAPKMEYKSSHRYIQHSKSLVKLIAWGYFNKIITANTQLHIVSRHVDNIKLRQFITDLRLSFPVEAPESSQEDMHHPNEIRNLVLVINLTSDPTAKLKNIPRTVHSSDIFNFSSNEKSLVGSVSLIYRNVWNEIRTQHFESDDAILKALKVVSNRIYQSAGSPHSVNVYCYSKYLRSELREAMADLVHKCITIQTGTIVQRDILNTLKVSDKTWQLVFEKQNELLQDKERIIGKSEVELNILGKSLKEPDIFPAQISEFVSEGFLQFFFEDNADSSFNVYVVDEHNAMECYYNCNGEKGEKIREINRLQSDKKIKDDVGIIQNSFNYPQFYQLISLNNEIHIVPFHSRQHLDYLEQKNEKLKDKTLYISTD